MDKAKTRRKENYSMKRMKICGEEKKEVFKAEEKEAQC